MKILILTPRLPYPVIGGDKIRIYNICKILSEAGHQLTLLSFVENKNEAELAQNHPDKRIFSRVSTIVLSKQKSWFNSFIGLFRRWPLQISYYQSKKMTSLADKEIASGNYDAILVHLIRMAPYAMKHSNVKKVLEMTDAISMNYSRSGKYKVKGLSGKVYLLGQLYRIEEERVRRYEEECIDKFDSTVVVSDVDRNYLTKNLTSAIREKVKVIPHGVAEKFLEVASVDYNPNLIIFMGNMRTFQNTDAALYFIKEIYPLIQAKHQSVKFRVIGNEPPLALRKFDGQKGIEITGRVDEVINYAKGAAVSVCPMRIGAGIQTKVLESMAMGVPVVLTSVAAEGIEGKAGEHFLVADTAQEFAAEVLKIIKNPSLRNRLSRAGKELARRYRYSVIAQEYIKLFSSN